MADIRTNKEFARTDTKFNAACVVTTVPPTARQASKFRNKKGKVYKQMKGIK